uniref:Uncharacterized protein n=1 Tax=Pyxicephalus adspersus TaxID=30357 RepID=A0AAV3B712_PYXAD|nr:TPA: hypothetical protein GDO54_001738 [Pyxicephalus adspersus]
MKIFSSADVRRLLHNKYVAVLGDFIQRSLYKDLVKILQNDEFLNENQLKSKGEMSFANDTLVEGGSLGEMHNGITYREVSQYRTDHHLVRFYFQNHVYSEYIESVLADFEQGPQPNVVIINSCIWDAIRYHDQSLEMYKTNLTHLFIWLTKVLSPECLDIIEENFYDTTLADLHNFDVIDVHFHFCFELCSRVKDATHWNQLAHQYTCILMAHIAQAWGVQPPDQCQVRAPSTVILLANNRSSHPPFSQERIPSRFGPRCLSGYTSFDGIDPSHTIETFNPGNVGYRSNQIHSNAISPFVDDSPLLVGNFSMRNMGMTIYPHHLAVPDIEFGTFQYNSPMPQETWSGHQRFPKRKGMRLIHGWVPSYIRPLSFPSRV